MALGNRHCGGWSGRLTRTRACVRVGAQCGGDDTRLVLMRSRGFQPGIPGRWAGRATATLIIRLVEWSGLEHTAPIAGVVASREGDAAGWGGGTARNRRSATCWRRGNCMSACSVEKGSRCRRQIRHESIGQARTQQRVSLRRRPSSLPLRLFAQYTSTVHAALAWLPSPRA